ncbi:clathrin interactor EPSIN 2-like [Lolium rigidum]|uniref:clathrin interactor EPSIN 2-like n=1 Tax=Lolium rigidum TaxID=89674 RepID=UPI001F5D010C|nr:clathrin interactor EPSIN 2-like [Lolium rigidum]
MKKVFDQTVRDLKRGVNKKVLKVPGTEQKILDATSNEPWGPHGSLLAEIAQATNNYHEYQMIMNIVWKRVSDTGKNWRHVYKGLIVLDYLVAHGTERVIDDIREHAYQISALADFQYIDSSGRDQGSNVRRKSQSLVSLVNDKERVQEVRQKALATRDKYRSSFATSGTHRSPGGYDNDRYEGGRYDSRNGYGRERDGYRDDDRYSGAGDTPNREGDRYSRDSNDRNREDEYRGSNSNPEYAEGSGRRSYGEEEAYSSRGRGSNADAPTQDERPIERKPSNQQIASPPTYEDVTRDAQDNHHEERNGASVPAAAPKLPSPSVPIASSPPGQVNGVHDKPVEVVAAQSPAHAEPNGFDEFDPRGSVPDASPPVNPSPAVNSFEMDLFGSDPIGELALVSVPQPTATPNVEPPANSGFETNSFMGMPPASTGFSEEIDASNPFGDPTPFKAVHEENHGVPQTNAAPAGSFQATGPGADANPFQLASAASFGFEDTLGDLSFPSNAAPGQQDIFGSTSSLPSGVSHANPSVFQAAAPNTHAAPTFAHPPAHPAATNPSSFSQPAATSFAPAQAPQPAAPNQPSDPSNFFMPPASGTGLSGVPSQNGAPSYMPQQPSHLAASQNGAPSYMPQQPSHLAASQNGAPSYMPQQPSHLPASVNQYPPQQSFLPPTAAAAPQPTSISRVASQPFIAPSSMPSGGNIPLQSSSSAPPETIISAMQVRQTEPVKKFEPKSTVWSDTLTRGLVDFNISGSKTNPHADIGVDFDSMNRKDKRFEKKISQAPVVSTITMGKAMGSGSGIGRAGASAAAPPSNPMGAGRGVGAGAGYGGGMGMNRPMGMGMGMNPQMGMGMNQQQPMGMGMGMNQHPMGMNQQPMGMNQQQMGMGMGMNQQPMGMNMGMNQGMGMRPPMGMAPGGMPGAGYNQMGAGYGGQQPYGGYR